MNSNRMFGLEITSNGSVWQHKLANGIVCVKHWGFASLGLDDADICRWYTADGALYDLAWHD